MLYDTIQQYKQYNTAIQYNNTSWGTETHPGTSLLANYEPHGHIAQS
jgi:hypothetical protein